jgi:hypothetical protein
MVLLLLPGAGSAFGADSLGAVAGAGGLVAGGLDGLGGAVVLAGLPDDRVGVLLAAVVDSHPIPRARAASRSRTACRSDWVGAGGTVFAFFVALRLLDKELEVRREQQEDRRSVQARLVSQWIPEPERQAPTPNFVFAVIVHNGSEEPIYNVTITMAPPDSAHAADPEAGPTEAGTLRYQRPVMAPGETFRDEHPMVPDLPGQSYGRKLWMSPWHESAAYLPP